MHWKTRSRWQPRDSTVDEPALELVAREAMRFAPVPRRAAHAQLELALRQVHADDRASFGSNGYGKAHGIHVGLRRVMRRHPHHATPPGTLMAPNFAEDSTPIRKRGLNGAHAPNRFARQERAPNTTDGATCAFGGACAAILRVRNIRRQEYHTDAGCAPTIVG